MVLRRSVAVSPGLPKSLYETRPVPPCYLHVSLRVQRWLCAAKLLACAGGKITCLPGQLVRTAGEKGANKVGDNRDWGLAVKDKEVLRWERSESVKAARWKSRGHVRLDSCIRVPVNNFGIVTCWRHRTTATFSFLPLHLLPKPFGKRCKEKDENEKIK